MQVIVYTKPNCQQCGATYRALDTQGVQYTKVDISKDVEAYVKVRLMGYLQVPVVYVNDDNHWSGFRPDKIKEIE